MTMRTLAAAALLAVLGTSAPAAEPPLDIAGKPSSWFAPPPDVT